MNSKKISALVAVLLCLSMLLCACNAEPAAPTTEATAPTAEPTQAPTIPTPAATEPEDDKVTYTVTVVDEAGNPVSGALVQLCLDACIPNMTDDNGVATYTVEEADYKVSFLQMPEGYDYSTQEQEFYFADGAYEMTIVLKAA